MTGNALLDGSASLCRFTRRLAAALLAAMLLAVMPQPAMPTARASDEATAAETLDAKLAQMSLHEKVCQLFFVRPEQFSRLKQVRAKSAKLRAALTRFPVGGVILFGGNMQSGAKLTELNADMQSHALSSSGVGLLIGVDEEGGGVSRVANKLKRKDRQPVAFDIGQTGDSARAEASGTVIGGYLSGYGFNLDFAPVADVRSDVRNAEIGARAYSDSATTAAEMAAAFIRGLHGQGVMSVAKHFPGHGPVSGNTHLGMGTSTLTVEEARVKDWLPFIAAMRENVDMVMISHQTALNLDPDAPACFSRAIVTGLLRGELGYDGVVITDALEMKAVRNLYGSGEASVRAIEAGCDMLLLPYNFTNAYEGVMNALKSGRLSEARIDESVRRILRLKQRYALLQ